MLCCGDDVITLLDGQNSCCIGLDGNGTGYDSSKSVCCNGVVGVSVLMKKFQTIKSIKLKKCI